MVKNWEQTVGKSEIENYIQLVRDIQQIENKQGYFIYYAVNGFTEEAKELLQENEIMYSSHKIWKLEI